LAPWLHHVGGFSPAAVRVFVLDAVADVSYVATGLGTYTLASACVLLCSEALHVCWRLCAVVEPGACLQQGCAWPRVPSALECFCGSCPNVKSLAVLKQATALSSRPYAHLLCTTAVSSIVWLCSVPTCRMSICLDSLWCWFASQPEAESQALTSHVIADALASSIASYQCVTHHSSCTVACLCSAMVRRVLLLAIQRPSLGKAACTCRLPCRCQIGLRGTLAATLV
jgi:hypothetical protein